jgi:TonB family protein
MNDPMKASSAERSSFRFTAGLLVMAAVLFWGLLTTPVSGMQTSQSQGSTRKAKVSTPPEYPELARKLKIQGVARVLLTVTPDGRVIGVKELGGNPVLLSALADAVKKWRYEAADHESTIEVRFEFR